MRIQYDPEGDILEIIFNEQFHLAEKRSIKLRDGIILFISKTQSVPVQLTLVNYKKAAQLPSIFFDGWNRLEKNEKRELLPIINSSSISAFLRFDPQTGYGHLSSPGMLDVFSEAV